MPLRVAGVRLRGRLALYAFSLKRFFDETEGLSRATLSLLGESWCLVSFLWVGSSGAPSVPSTGGFGLGQLVTNSKFLAVDPYSFWIHFDRYKGSLPFLEKKPWVGHCQNSNVVPRPKRIS